MEADALVLVYRAGGEAVRDLVARLDALLTATGSSLLDLAYSPELKRLNFHWRNRWGIEWTDAEQWAVLRGIDDGLITTTGE